MKKIPSLFVRDWDGDRRLVLDEVTPGCEWVTEGEGVAYRKWDGTCCMIRDGVLYRRHDRKRHRKTGEVKAAPPNWEACEAAPNEHTGHWPGWVPVGDGPEDKWHRAAAESSWPIPWIPDAANCTRELCGPKVQGNPERLSSHRLVLHTEQRLNCSREFEGLHTFFKMYDMEGVVWHHPDGRMCKIKASDFGLSRHAPVTSEDSVDPCP